jgi:hypothetical protein
MNDDAMASKFRGPRLGRDLVGDALSAETWRKRKKGEKGREKTHEGNALDIANFSNVKSINDRN